MRTHLTLGLLIFVAGCATDPVLGTSTGALQWDDADTLSVIAQTQGVPGPASMGPDSTRDATRYDFADGRLVRSNCGVERVHLGTAQDTADLRAALHGLQIVEIPCEGNDGTDVVATVLRGAEDPGPAYPVGGQSCTQGGDPTRPVPMISAASWGPVQAVIQRIATR